LAVAAGGVYTLRAGASRAGNSKIMPTAAAAALLLLLSSRSANAGRLNATGESTVLLWGPGWSRNPPSLALRGIRLGESTAQGPFAVWENYAEIPRAVELLPGGSKAAHSKAHTSAFFADTQGSLFMLEPRVAVHELIKRDPSAGVDNSILSLAYDAASTKLYFTVNSTLVSLAVKAGGTKPDGEPQVVADFAPSGVQNLIVDWSSSPSPTAYFCLFDGPNRTAGSLVRAPLNTPKKYEVLINSTLSVLSGRPFGDAMPRFALDLPNTRLYYVIFAIGVSSIDLTDPSAAPKRVPLRTGFRSGSPLVALSIALLPAQPAVGGSSEPLLVITSVAGNIGVVPVSGGDVVWVSSPCGPGGGCSYRQLWDLKLLPALSTRLAIGAPAPAPAPAPAAYSLLATWISVTDLDSSAATVQGASVQVINLIRNATSGNLTSLNVNVLYDTRWHRGHSGLLVQPHTCTAYLTQSSHSSIFTSPVDPMQPVTANYTYRNFRFNPSFTIDDRKKPRSFWFEQYQNPHAAGDNGYALQLMSADLNDLAGRTSVLTSLCNTHAGELAVDPATGDVIFQSTARSSYSVQHYCYRKALASKATLFYTQLTSYQAVNVAIDWKARVMYVSGTAFRTSESAIRRVSIDAADPKQNPEEVVARNTSANAMGIAGDMLYYVQVSSYGPRKFQSSVLYSCTPGQQGSPQLRRVGMACDTNHSTNLSAIPNSFSDQFSSVGLIAESDERLLFWSQRGNSIARVLSRYSVKDKSWRDVYITPFGNPIAIASSSSKLHYIDGSLSTFGSFTPIPSAGAFNVPFTITGRVFSTSRLGSGQPYPANGASGGWGRQIIAGSKDWFWLGAADAQTIGGASTAVFTAAMEHPKPAQLLTLAPNATANLLAVDETKNEMFYVVRTPPRPGPQGRSLCGQSNQGAESLVKASFTGSGEDPTVVLAQPNGWCFGRGSPALDAKRGLLYYSLQDQYSMFMSNSHLAVLDLKSGLSRRLDWGFVINFKDVDFRILRLSDDGNTLWSWGCVRASNGCASRMYRINVGPDSPPSNNWTNATLGSLGPGTYSSGLQDFSVREQENSTAFTFVAYTSPQTTPPVMGVYSANYVARGEITWQSELQPVAVSNVDVDATDAKAGLLIAVRPPVAPFQNTPGILLLRAPLVGVGTGDGSTLTSTVLPWPEELPISLRTSNMVQLAHQKPDRLLFAFGRANCISDEIWEADLSTSTLARGGGHLVTAPPEQLVSALLPISGGMLQGQSDGDGGTELSWVKCSSRIVFADVKKSAAVADPIEYEDLDYAWLDITLPDAGSRMPSLRTVSRVDDVFIFTFSSTWSSNSYSSIYSGKRQGHHIEQITLLSNSSTWLALSASVVGQTVYIGERNQSAPTAATANAQIRSIELSVAAREASAAPALKVFVADTGSVDGLSSMPAACVPSDGMRRNAAIVDE
jgi:hypothetical protein